MAYFLSLRCADPLLSVAHVCRAADGRIAAESPNSQGGDFSPGVDAAARSFEVFVREWVVRKGLSGPTCEFTVARPVDWKVPSIERMWLGLSEDDRLRRLRAFLTVMRSDTPFILAGLLVPQHMLLMVCVLRYILHHGHVLQSAELNAFLAMATSPLLNDVQTVQDVKVSSELWVSLNGGGSGGGNGVFTMLFQRRVYFRQRDANLLPTGSTWTDVWVFVWIRCRFVLRMVISGCGRLHVCWSWDKGENGFNCWSGWVHVYRGHVIIAEGAGACLQGACHNC